MILHDEINGQDTSGMNDGIFQQIGKHKAQINLIYGKISRQRKKLNSNGKMQQRIWKQRLYREKKMDQNEIQQKEEALRKESLLQQLQEERKKLDSQIRSRSDLLKNLEASQKVDRILELYYGN